MYSLECPLQSNMGYLLEMGQYHVFCPIPIFFPVPVAKSQYFLIYLYLYLGVYDNTKFRFYFYFLYRNVKSHCT